MTVAEYRARKPAGHRFWGEVNGCDPRFPLHCMSWRGGFAVLHEDESNWLASMWHWLRRKNRKRVSKMRRRIRRWWRNGIASW
jgi:hypothetical protein